MSEWSMPPSVMSGGRRECAARFDACTGKAQTPRKERPVGGGSWQVQIARRRSLPHAREILRRRGFAWTWMSLHLPSTWKCVGVGDVWLARLAGKMEILEKC